jgi:hypothetical protein
MKVKRKKTSNNNLIPLAISFISMILALFCFINYYRVDNDNIGNLYVSFYDFSKTKEDVSCKIIFDDSIFYEIDKISTSKTKRFKLQNGRHKVEISDLKNRFYLKDSILIKNYPEENNLYVCFKYNPSYEDYLPIFRKQYFDNFIQKHKKEYYKEQYKSIMEQINQQIDVEFLKKTYYQPFERKFTITFYEEPIYIN